MTLDELRAMVERGRAWRSTPADDTERSRELVESQQRTTTHPDDELAPAAPASPMVN